jgi:hypothetical protein
MKKNEVEIGKVYAAKVTNRIVQVRIHGESRYGGWDVTNLVTGKRVRIHSAQRLRAGIGDSAATGDKVGRGKRKAKAADEPQPAPTSSPTAEDVATPETPVEGGADGQVPTEMPKVDKPQRTRAKKEPKEKRMSGLAAAAKVLEESGLPMSAKEMVEVAQSKGYWKSPGGKTPHATLYSAILREIAAMADQARFKKTDRGRFAANR